jgi:hypothetical protein
LNQIASKRKFIKKNESYTGTVHFHCDLSERANPFPHFWEHAVGGDHGQWLCAQTTSRSSGEASCENGPRTSIGSRQDDRSFYTEWNTSSNPRDPLRRALRGCIRDQDRDGSERPGVHARSAPLTVCMINCHKEPLWTPLAKHKGILPPQAYGARVLKLARRIARRDDRMAVRYTKLALPPGGRS